MGIQGLLPFLKPLSRKCGIEEFHGKTIGVDAMCWMHKGAFACSEELLLGKDTDKFVAFFLRMCELLRYYQIKPIIVFDGAKLPAKAIEDQNRQESRQKARDEALDLHARRSRGEQIDDRALAKATGGAIRVTTAMISRMMVVLRELGIEFLVAPYEADAQLAYMCQSGWLDAVISEDSDLLAYGCPNTLLKMDKFGQLEQFALPCLQRGHKPTSGRSMQSPAKDEEAVLGDESEADGKDPDVQPEKDEGGRGRGSGRGRGRGRGAAKPKVRKSVGKVEVNVTELSNWSAEKFTEFCVLCGTDYKEYDVHIKGLGPKTAFQQMARFDSIDGMLASMAEDPKWQARVPCDIEEYMKRYRSVVAVFWHHTVFNPRRGMCVSIATSFVHGDRALPGVDLVAYCGVVPTKEDAKRNWKGETEPRSGLPRERVELTKTERHALDVVLGKKRAQQQQFEFEQKYEARRKADAERAHAAHLARGAPALTPVPSQQAQAATEQQRNADADRAHEAFVLEAELDKMLNEGVDAHKALDPKIDSHAPPDVAAVARPKPPREFFLLPGDVDAILALRGSTMPIRPGAGNEDEGAEGGGADLAGAATAIPAAKLSGEDGTPPRAQVLAPEVTPPQSSNPFARKRTAGAAGIPPVLDKRPRLVAPVPAPVRAAPQRAAPTPDDRTLVEADGGKYGGYARQHAVLAVLAQRGRPELVPLPEDRDRRKITSFFSGAAKSKIIVLAKEPVVAVPSALEAWRAQPWATQGEEVDPFAVAVNPLTSKRTGPSASLFGKKGW